MKKVNRNIPYWMIIMVCLSFVNSLFLLQLFLGLLTLLWLLEPNKKIILDGFTFFIFLFGALRVLSVIFSSYPSISSEIFYKEILFYLGFLSMNYYFKTFNEKKIYSIILFFLFGAVLASIIAIIKFNLNLDQRAQSFSSGYTVFSEYIAAVLPFTIFINNVLRDKKKSFAAVTVIITLLFSAGIVSLGRTTIVIMILIIFTMLLLSKLSLKTIPHVLIFTAIISIISFNNNSLEINSRINTPYYLSDRDILLKGAEDLLWEKPVLGFGPRTFDKIFPYKEQFADKGIGGWHNDFIQIYFESGVLGLTTFLALIIFIIIKSYTIFKKTKKTKFRLLSLGVLVSTLGLTLSAFTAGFITSVVLSIVFAFLVSLLSAIHYKDSKSFR